MLRSGAVTVVGSEDELLFGLMSPPPETVPVFVTDGNAATPTLTVAVNELLALAAIGPGLVQVPTWPTAFQVQPVPLAPVGVNPAGKVSVAVIRPLLGAVPTLEPVMV